MNSDLDDISSFMCKKRKDFVIINTNKLWRKTIG